MGCAGSVSFPPTPSGGGNISILNKGTITATTETVQSVATAYIQSTYGRTPKNNDALIITLTDKDNDAVMYIYAEAAAQWVNVGLDVDLSKYVPIDQGVQYAGLVLGIGADGRVTPVSGGSGSGDKTYVFTQSVASSIWQVTHSLNKYPSVTVVDTGKNIVYGDVNYVDLNNVTLTFSAAFSGMAYFN